jgi:hypothetical protein
MGRGADSEFGEQWTVYRRESANKPTQCHDDDGARACTCYLDRRRLGM